MSNFTFDDDSVIVNDFEALLMLQNFYKLIISPQIIQEILEIEKLIQAKRQSLMNRTNEDFLESESYEALVDKFKIEDIDLEKLALTFPNKNLEFYSKNKLINSFIIQNN